MEGEGKSFMELLGINKPEEWATQQYRTCSDTLAKNEAVFSTFAAQLLIKTENLPFILVIKLNKMEETLTQLVKAFYTLGYMKGKVAQEGEDRLEEIWGEEK